MAKFVKGIQQKSVNSPVRKHAGNQDQLGRVEGCTTRLRCGHTNDAQVAQRLGKAADVAALIEIGRQRTADGGMIPIDG